MNSAKLEFIKDFNTLHVNYNCDYMDMVTIPKNEYKRLKEIEKVDKEILEDIALGIKDIIAGKVKEV